MKFQMMIKKVVGPVQKATFKSALKVKKYSPEILLGVGIIGGIGATVLACRATLKAEEVLDTHKSKMEKVKEAREKVGEEKYTTQEYNRDIVVVKVQTAVDFARLYGPSLALGATSIACILSSYNIMRKRNIALAAAYILVEGAFSEYRGRVVSELGEAKDFHFRYGTEELEATETVLDETGKKVKVKKTVQKLPDNPFGDKGYSMYARMYEPKQMLADGHWTGSGQFSRVHHYNVATLRAQEQWMNDKLNVQGYVFLGDVYEILGFDRDAASQCVGWVLGNGDNYISFGPKDFLLAYEDGDGILLDFNVDGPILDLI